MGIIGYQDRSGMQTGCCMDYVSSRSCREVWFALENILFRLLNDNDPSSNEFKKAVRFKLEGVSFIF
jgi:hypothetical protein